MSLNPSVSAFPILVEDGSILKTPSIDQFGITSVDSFNKISSHVLEVEVKDQSQNCLQNSCVGIKTCLVEEKLLFWQRLEIHLCLIVRQVKENLHFSSLYMCLLAINNGGVCVCMYLNSLALYQMFVGAGKHRLWLKARTN